MEKYYKELEHQDWKIIKVNNAKSVDPKENIINKKKKENPNIQKIKNIEKKAADDDLKHNKIKTEVKQLIIKARISKCLTQKQLAQKCNLNIQIINDIETGKAIYNHIHINKIKRVLNI